MSLDGSSPDRGKTPNFCLLKVMRKKLAFPDLNAAVVDPDTSLRPVNETEPGEPASIGAPRARHADLDPARRLPTRARGDEAGHTKALTTSLTQTKDPCIQRGVHTRLTPCERRLGSVLERPRHHRTTERATKLSRQHVTSVSGRLQVLFAMCLLGEPVARARRDKSLT